MTTSIKNIFESFLDQGKLVICIDSRKPNVNLPPQLMDRFNVRLNLSRHFQTKIFEITETQIRIDLGFNGVRFLCEIPFSSIYYVALAENTNIGIEFPENSPDEIKPFQDPEVFKQAERLIAVLSGQEIGFKSDLATSDVAPRTARMGRHDIDLSAVVEKQSIRKAKAKSKQ